MFGKLKELATGATKRFAGKTDLLEAAAAACALIAAADGEIEDSELVAIQEALVSHPTIAGAFKQSEIEKVAEKMLSRAKGTLGRVGLMKEIEEARAKSTADDLEMVMAIAIDISMADGEMEPAERKVLDKIAGALGVNLKAMLDA